MVATDCLFIITINNALAREELSVVPASFWTEAGRATRQAISRRETAERPILLHRAPLGSTLSEKMFGFRLGKRLLLHPLPYIVCLKLYMERDKCFQSLWNRYCSNTCWLTLKQRECEYYWFNKAAGLPDQEIVYDDTFWEVWKYIRYSFNCMHLYPPDVFLIVAFVFVALNELLWIF